jgi:hypothetical protein
MPKFNGQNKKRLDPRYFLNETAIKDKETFNSKGYDKKTGAYGPRGSEEYSTASARDKNVKGQKGLKEYEEDIFPEPQFTPEQQVVIDKMDELHDAIEAMGESSPEMTDYYVHLFRALKRARAGSRLIL